MARTYAGEQPEIQPGISAVLLAQAGQTELDSAVLDLAAVLDGLVLDNFEIIVVDPAPTRRLVDVLVELRVRFPHLPVRLLDGQYNDQASALSSAFGAAVYDLIFVTSADGQYDMRELNHLLAAIEHGADLAIGYRSQRADGLVQRLDGWGWNLLVNLVFGRTAQDVDCAFKLFRQAVWRRVGMHSRGTATFYTELLVRARRLGFIVAEVPVRHHRAASYAVGNAATPKVIWQALFDLKAMRGQVDRSQCASETPASAAMPIRGRAA